MLEKIVVKSGILSLDMPLNMFSFSNRAANTLERSRINKLGELYELYKVGLSECRGMGTSVINELEPLLKLIDKIIKGNGVLDEDEDGQITYDTEIREIPLSVRTINVFKRLKITNVEQLYIYGIENLKKVSGAGEKTIREAEDILRRVIVKSSTTRAIITWRPEIYNIRLILSPYSINEILRQEQPVYRIVNMLKDDLAEKDADNIKLLIASINTIKDYEIEEITDIISPETSKFSSFEKLEEFINDCLNKLRYEAKYIILNRFDSESMTLEEIAQELGLTRERVRQLECKNMQRLRFELNKNLQKIVNTFPKNYYYKDKSRIIDLCLSLLIDVFQTYNPKSNKIYVKKDFYDKFEDEVKRIENVISETGYYSLDDESILEEELIIKLFRDKYDIRDGKIYQKATTNSAVMQVLKDCGRELCMNEPEDVEYLKQTLFNDYNIVIGEENNSAYNLRVLNDKAVLWGPKTFIHPDNIKDKLSNNLLQKIKLYIEKYEIVSDDQLYNEFKYELKNNGIPGPEALYGYLKYVGSEDYQFGGVSGVISIIGKEPNWYDTIITLINIEQRPITKRELQMRYPGISEIVYQSILINSDSIIRWGTSRLYLASLVVVTDEYKKIIYNYIEESGGAGTTSLLRYLRTNHEEILKDNYIIDENTLICYLKYAFNKTFNYENNGEYVTLV